jgi:hypothetical protein
VSQRSFFFPLFFLFSSQAREAAKSKLVLFHEALEVLRSINWKKSFNRFERAAAKGHEESIWITSVVKDVEMEQDVWKETFAKTETPLGWYFAGMLSTDRERFDFTKKSAEGGCSWGQMAYGWCFGYGQFERRKDEKIFFEWLEKAANQNNPEAMEELGRYCLDYQVKSTAASKHFRDAAELGWQPGMFMLAKLLRDGDGCEKDLRRAAILGAKGSWGTFVDVLDDALNALEGESTVGLDCDFDQLCYVLGWGFYWYQFEMGSWSNLNDEQKAFGIRCMDYYCSCVELQQKSIFTFLWWWNQATGGVKGPGHMIVQMVWEGREENLVKSFEEEPELLKRIKK